ncbi:MAG: hypothetical protein IJ583_17915 [Firmicutes bacterium]|nr:hypothetical protein [Bacillota bacterium]
MSKDHYGFENERGETGFLAGVVDVISDELEMVLDFGYSLDADIFCIRNNDMTLLNDSVKRRLHCYNQRYGCNIPKEKIDSIDFKLDEIKTDVSVFVSQQIKEYSSNDKLSDEVGKFLDVLRWHLHKPLCVYVPVKMNDKNVNILGKIYLYEAWKYFFISYNEYMVLLILGTVE